MIASQHEQHALKALRAIFDGYTHDRSAEKVRAAVVEMRDWTYDESLFPSDGPTILDCLAAAERSLLDTAAAIGELRLAVTRAQVRALRSPGPTGEEAR